MRKSVLKISIVLCASLVIVIGTVLAVNGISHKNIDKGGKTQQTQSGTVSPKQTGTENPKQTGAGIKPQSSDTTPSDNISINVNLKHALIVFTFDDGNESDYMLAYPILKKYGIEGTSYINPYNADHNVKYKLSWNEIDQMYNSGWNIGDHTYTHIDFNKATPTDINRTMAEDNESFLRNGLKLPDVFAYPYGHFTDTAIDILKHYRKQARLAYYKEDFVDPHTVNTYEIPCISADMQTDRLLQAHERIVDKAVTQNAVIVFRVHCMYQNKIGDTGNQPVETNSNLFAQLVDYCVKKGCDFTTMDGLIQLYTNGTITKPQSPQKISDTLQTSWQKSNASDKYIFYSTGDGLYRTNLDGSGKMLLRSGQSLKFAGATGNWVYYTEDGKLYRINQDGGQPGLLSDTPVSSVIIVSGNVYCIQSGKIYVLNNNGSLAPVIPIPETLLTEPKALLTDGENLYLGIYYQKSLCDIYKCNATNGNMSLIPGKAHDDPLILKDGYAIEYYGGSVYKEDMRTRVKETLFNCSDMIMDMTSYNDWLVYITKSLDKDNTYIKGYNIATGKTFSLESKFDYIYQTLPTKIVVCDSEHNDALSLLTINGNDASVSALKS